MMGAGDTACCQRAEDGVEGHGHSLSIVFLSFSSPYGA